MSRPAASITSFNPLTRIRSLLTVTVRLTHVQSGVRFNPLTRIRSLLTQHGDGKGYLRYSGFQSPHEDSFSPDSSLKASVRATCATFQSPHEDSFSPDGTGYEKGTCLQSVLFQSPHEDSFSPDAIAVKGSRRVQPFQSPHEDSFSPDMLECIHNQNTQSNVSIPSRGFVLS